MRNQVPCLCVDGRDKPFSNMREYSPSLRAMAWEHGALSDHVSHCQQRHKVYTPSRAMSTQLPTLESVIHCILSHISLSTSEYTCIEATVIGGR